MDAETFKSQCRSAAFAEIARQQRNIAHSFAQCRRMDRKYAEPVIEIGAKLPLEHCLFQIPIGGSQDPDIDLERRVIANALQVAILQDSEQFGLE